MKYFLHDTNAFQDEKITELFIQHGYEGLGLFYTILEKLALQEKPIKTVVLKKQLSVGKKLEKAWNYLEEIGLISSNNGETFNENILKFSEKYQIKKEKTKERVAKWRDSQEDIKNVTRYNGVRNEPKVKRSEVKDTDVSKGKNVSVIDGKQAYRDNVWLKTDERDALIKKYGEDFVERCFDKLSGYKLSNGKEYKSDYGAINSWVVEEVQRAPTRTVVSSVAVNPVTPRPVQLAEIR